SAVVEMSAARSLLGGYISELSTRNLPPTPLRKMHVGLGFLDAELIGGAIGMSSGGDTVTHMQAWQETAKQLWLPGATLAYGGDPRQGGLTVALQEALADLPPELCRPDEGPPVRLLVHDAVFRSLPADRAVGPLSGKSAMEKAYGTQGEGKRIEDIDRAIHLFHERWQMNARCVARVLMTGQYESFSGRMPGLLEEAMLAL